MIEPYVKENITTEQLDDICYKYITKTLKAYPGVLNYNGFPKSICVSINNEACHGIPNERILQNGDILNIDVAVMKDNHYGDSSRMFKIGKISAEAEFLLKKSKECLYNAIKIIKPNIKINMIGETIETYANLNKLSVAKEYCGHGIGKKLHEDPYILHCKNNDNSTLKEHMIFTIEPIITLGNGKTIISKNKWTALTKDKKLSAQWEHTILVTKNGYEILTLRKNEKLY